MNAELMQGYYCRLVTGFLKCLKDNDPIRLHIESLLGTVNADLEWVSEEPDYRALFELYCRLSTERGMLCDPTGAMV